MIHERIITDLDSGMVAVLDELLQVPAGNANRDDGLSVLCDQRRRKCDSWTFARLNAIRMAGCCVETAQPVALRNSRGARLVAH